MINFIKNNYLILILLSVLLLAGCDKLKVNPEVFENGEQKKDERYFGLGWEWKW